MKPTFPLNAEAPNDVTVTGIVRSPTNDWFPPKADSPIVCNPLPSVKVPLKVHDVKQ